MIPIRPGCSWLALIGFLSASPQGMHALGAESGRDITISGRIELPSARAAGLLPGDRLVFKLFHPEHGIEKDVRYWIIDQIAFPKAFELAPSTDMNGLVRWRTYRVQVFTDRDRDVLRPCPDRC